ncbi:MFS transporter [Agrobacterium vitis]|uniref:MFS transporter n=1 Tax=Agrobacterium vitis TaxID=373 RepID=UPI00191E1B65|nr:MFS transporter [Agrobacterium vitis]
MSLNSARLRPTLALATILTAQLMLTMDFLIVLVALPKIQTELGFTPAGLSWVPNAFALAFGGLLLLGGRLGDLYGQVKAFKIGIAISSQHRFWAGWPEHHFSSLPPASFRASGPPSRGQAFSR